MKFNIPVAAIVSMVLLSSCSSMYRTGQTPDDVYYSPTRPGANVARHTDDEEEEEYSYINPDDNYLRMKVQNRNRWNTINDADYWYSYNRPYSNLYGYNAFNSPYYGNSLTLGLGNVYGYNTFGGYPFWNTWNYGYPGYSGIHGLNGGYYGGYNGGYYPSSLVRPLRSNTGPKPYMGSYSNGNYNNTNNSNRNNSSGLGRFIRNTVNGNSNRSEPAYNNSNSYDRPTRPFTPSSSPAASSNSSSGRSSGGSSSSSAGSRSGRGGR